MAGSLLRPGQQLLGIATPGLGIVQGSVHPALGPDQSQVQLLLWSTLGGLRLCPSPSSSQNPPKLRSPLSPPMGGWGLNPVWQHARQAPSQLCYLLLQASSHHLLSCFPSPAGPHGQAVSFVGNPWPTLWMPPYLRGEQEVLGRGRSIGSIHWSEGGGRED